MILDGAIVCIVWRQTILAGKQSGKTDGREEEHGIIWRKNDRDLSGGEPSVD